MNDAHLTPEETAVLKKLAAVAPKLMAQVSASRSEARTDSNETPEQRHHREVGDAWRRKPKAEQRTDSREFESHEDLLRHQVSNAWKRRSA